jgi:hypothetical protein
VPGADSRRSGLAVVFSTASASWPEPEHPQVAAEAGPQVADAPLKAIVEWTRAIASLDKRASDLLDQAGCLLAGPLDGSRGGSTAPAGHRLAEGGAIPRGESGRRAMDGRGGCPSATTWRSGRGQGLAAALRGEGRHSQAMKSTRPRARMARPARGQGTRCHQRRGIAG